MCDDLVWYGFVHQGGGRVVASGFRAPAGLEIRTPVAERPPHVLYVETTNRCNSLCPICPRTFDLRERDADLSYAQFVTILDQMPSATRLVLHGIGEPLMNRDLPLMVAEARRRGLHVLFNSNLVLLREVLAEALIAADLNELRVSMDAATPATYARIRGIDKLPQVTRMIRLMLATRSRLGASRPHVSMWFVAMQENIDELPAFIDLAAELGVTEVHVQRMTFLLDGHPAGYLAVREQSLYRAQSARQEAAIAAAQTRAAATGVTLSGAGETDPATSIGGDGLGPRPWSRCYRPWTTTYVTALGTVYPCCIAPFATTDHRSIELGNVFATPHAELWNSDRYRRFRELLLSDEPHPACRGCGSAWSL
jgi:MoaA/NifB/PqqE/SkfB family radical SAM enzyme